MEYIINYQYISEVLCINKNEPKSVCNGKCHLEEQLKEVKKEDNKCKSNYKIIKDNTSIICQAINVWKYNRYGIEYKQSIYYSFTIKSFLKRPSTPPPKC